jgi:Fe-S-cluster containining protein
VPILAADVRRWVVAGRAELVDSRVVGHFGVAGLAVDSLGDCVHLEERRCSIYRLRPDCCRSFEPGCAQCLVARRAAAAEET